MQGVKPQLRVAKVDVIPVEVPRRGSFKLQRGTTPASSPYTVVRITTDQGVVGYGEGDTQVRSLFAVARDHLAQALVGSDVLDLTGIHARMDAIEMMLTERLSHWNVARCAIDVALHDCIGKWLGVPVYQLLGGRQRDRVETVRNIGLDVPEACAAAAAQFAGEGHSLVKMRVGRDVHEDLARVRAVRAALPDAVGIRLDANQAWTHKDAVLAIGRLEPFGLEAVEQPCPFWDLRGGAAVTAAVATPVIADEGFWTANEAQLLLSAGAADILHVYLGKCGGLHPAMRISAVAQAFGREVTVGERVPLGISEAAHLHYAAALPRLRHPAALAYELNEHDLLVRPLHRERGAVVVPDGPGLGIEVDEDKLAYYERKAA